jgi:two-component system chemotaxis response regulator CheB
LVTARPSPANDKLFTEALIKGAAECMVKHIDDSYGENLDIIKRKIKDIIKVISNDRGDKETGRAAGPLKVKEGLKKNKFYPEIVLIAASTGGPSALETVISKLRGDFPVPVLIVQHIPAYFTANLGQNLDIKTAIKVKVAENRETIKAGTVYLAPGGTHMTLDSKNSIWLDDSPPRSGIRPAADVLFESVAEKFTGSKVLAVILTGMGSDGKDGLIKLKEKKECFCLTQSEQTCVVYGMPRAVAESGLADKVVDLDRIASEIESFIINE